MNGRRSTIGILILGMFFSQFHLAAQRRSARVGLPEYYRAFRSHSLDGTFSKAVFLNGLIVVVEEHPSIPLASISALVRVGQFKEGNRAEVLAEYVRVRLVQEVFEHGGEVEAEVTGFETTFTAIVPSENLLEGLEAFEAVFALDQWDDSQLEFCRQLVQRRQLSEHGERRARQAAAIGELAGLPIKVEADPLSSLDSLKEAYHRFYHPKNVIMTVSGTVRRERVLRKLVEMFGDLSSPLDAEVGDRVQDTSRAGKRGFRYAQVRGEGPLPQVLLGVAIPALGRNESTVLKLVSYLLTEGYGALLRAHTEGDKGSQLYEFESWQRSTSDGQLLILGFSSEEEDLDRSEVRVFSILQELSAVKLPTSVLNRAKALLVADFYASMESLGERTKSLAVAEFMGDYKSRDRLPERVQKVSADQVREFIGKYFSESSISVLEYLPEVAEARTFTSESWLETMRILLPSGKKELLGLLEALHVEDVPAFRAPVYTPTYAESGLKRSSVLRGPEIYLREQHSVPIVHVGFFFPGGRVKESPEHSGITEVLLRALLNQWMRGDAGRAVQRFESRGGRVSIINRPDFFGFQVRMLSRELNAAFLDMVMLLRTPVLTEADVSAGVKATLRSSFLAGESEADLLLRRARGLLFGRHPYTYAWQDNLEGIREFGFQEVEEWMKTSIEGIHPYILVSGEVEGTSFLQEFISRLSDRRFRVIEAEKVKIEYPEMEARHQEISLGDHTVLAFRGPQEGTYLVEIIDLALNLLSGEGGLLFEKLRIEEQLAERIEIIPESFVGGGGIFLRMSGPQSSLPRATELALEEIRSLREARVSAERFLDSVVGVISKLYLRGSDNDLFLIDTMEAVLAGETAEYRTNYILNLKQLRMGEVESALRRFVGSNPE